MYKARQYGSQVIERGTCDECGGTCLVCYDRTSSCCGATVKILSKGKVSKETTNSGGRRNKPPAYWQKVILERQSNRCFWCDREFGSYVVNSRGNSVELKPVWDHYVPFFYTGTCNKNDFVATCQRCNSHKSAKIIYNAEDELKMKEYLKEKWFANGWQDLNI